MRKTNYYLFSLVASSLLVASNSTYAVTPIVTGASTDPGVLSQQLKVPVATHKPIAGAAAAVPAAPAPGTAFPEEAKTIKFKLNQVIVEGSTVFTQAELASTYQSYIGKTITVADLETIRDAITAKYRKAGYIISKAILPPQSIENGIVHIQVIEGYISNIQIEGQVGKAASLIEAYGEHIEESRPLQASVLEKYVLLANNLPGVDVQAVLKPSQTETGAADLIFVTTEKHFDASLSFDNRGTRYLGPNRYTAIASAHDIFMPGDDTQLVGLTSSDPRELNYYQLSHVEQLNTLGTQLILDGDYTSTQPGYVLKSLEVDGRSTGWDATIKHPLLLSRKQDLYVDAGFDYLDSQTSILGSQVTDDRVRTFVAGANYDLTDSFNGINNVHPYITQGLDVMDASPEGSELNSRSDAKPDFTKINLDMSRLQLLTQRLSILFSTSGQYSFDPLLASEEMGIGGGQSGDPYGYGEAYDPAEIVGDSGLAGKAEFRIQTWPQLRYLQTAQFYTYYDGGVVWNYRGGTNITGQEGRESLTSAGFGVRMNFTSDLYGSLEWDQPISRKVAATDILGDGSSPRVFFSITVKT